MSQSQSNHVKNGNGKIVTDSNNNSNNNKNNINKSRPSKPAYPENEELKTDSNGVIKKNHSNTNILDTDNIELSSDELLDIGMLEHHEISDFTMEEEKIMANCQPVTWSNCDATTFEVRRGPNYVSGQKSPSKFALYTVFAVDAYKMDHKIHKIFKYTNIDKYIKKYAVPYDGEKFPLPPIIILNAMMPDYPPELMGTKSDGNGYQMIIYAHLSTETRDLLNKYNLDPVNNKLTPSIRLLSDFIHSDLVNSEIRNRFKCIARIMNPNHTDFGFLANRLVKRYNGKPFLARTSSTFYHEKGKYFAGDIDVHVFGYPARQGLSYVKDTIQTAIYDFGCVIEGVDNDQLPEQILCCARVCKLGVDVAQPFPDKFIKLYEKEMLIKKKRNKNKQINNNKEENIETKENDHIQQHQQQQHHHQQQKKIYPKSQTNLLLLNGNNSKKTINDNQQKKQDQTHRNGDVASKSASSLQATSTSNQQTGNKTQKQSNSSWGWGYFG